MKNKKTPLIGIPATPYENEGHTSHRVSEKYVKAVAALAGCAPGELPPRAKAFASTEAEVESRDDDAA